MADQTWANCLNHFKAAYKAHKKEATTQSGGYANHAVELASVTEAAANALERNNAMHANMATTSKNHEDRLAALEKIVTALADPREHGHCWSCGIGDHGSQQCAKKKRGHKNDATGKDRMGGSGHIDPRLHKLGLRLQSD